MIEIQHKDIQLSLKSDAITVCFGATGVGKSTLLKTLAGHLPIQGHLSFNEQTIVDKSMVVTPEMRQFGYLSQSLNLIPGITVKANLTLAQKLSKSVATPEALADIAHMLEIAPLLNRHTTALSGGERQLVSFALILLSASRWLLLDEPFSALDKPRLQRVLLRFKAWQRNTKTAVLYVTHDVHEMALIADDVLHITENNPPELMSYQSLMQSVDAQFMSLYANVNVLDTVWSASVDGLQLLHLKDYPEITLYALGDRPDHADQTLLIPMTDISISRYKLLDSSILNQLEGLLETIGAEQDGMVFVVIKIGGQRISARITAKSCHDLKLRPGILCVVCFKAPHLIAE